MLPSAEPLTTPVTWYVYLIECVDGSVYTGVTTDIERRYLAHLSGKGARYTRAHPPSQLLASYAAGSHSDALRAELLIKKQPKANKLATLRTFAANASLDLAGG